MLTYWYLLRVILYVGVLAKAFCREKKKYCCLSCLRKDVSVIFTDDTIYGIVTASYASLRTENGIAP